MRQLTIIDFIRSRQVELAPNYWVNVDFLLKIFNVYVWKGKQCGMFWKEFVITHRGWWMFEWFQVLRTPGWTYVWDRTPIITIMGWNSEIGG